MKIAKDGTNAKALVHGNKECSKSSGIYGND